MRCRGRDRSQTELGLLDTGEAARPRRLPGCIHNSAKSQKERIYLDAFAGEGSGVDRLTGQEFTASARVALEVTDPAFTKFRFFELPAKARALEKQLKSEYPGRDIRVYPGDSNATIPVALANLKRLRWAPTFAFLDPDGMQLSWKTLESLAQHKRGYRRPGAAKPEYKVEMWMLFPTQGLIRTLTLKKLLAESDARRASRLFGSDTWRAIYDSRRRNEFSGEQASVEYLNLMRYRLERDLGYRWTHPLAIKNLRGRLIYHMIFATDNGPGPKSSPTCTNARHVKSRRCETKSFETSSNRVN